MVKRAIEGNTKIFHGRFQPVVRKRDKKGIPAGNNRDLRFSFTPALDKSIAERVEPSRAESIWSIYQGMPKADAGHDKPRER